MVSKDRNLVLVVDDDLGMLKAIKRLLRQHDYEPILFSSARHSKAIPMSKRQLASSSTST